MATRIPLRELKNQCSAIVRRAEAGEEFEVTVDGRPCAKVTPLHPQGPRTWVPAADILAFADAVHRIGAVTPEEALGELAEPIGEEFDDPFARYAGWMDG